MIFRYLYTDMSLKRFVILSILSVSTLVAYASATDDSIAPDTIWFDDGAWYVGGIADSLFNGYGKMVYPDSTIYQGEWQDGLWEGKGELYYPDGDYYSGDFHNHQFSGYGKYTYSDGAFYDGYWADNMFNGSGTMSYADGSIYAGEWVNDKKNGVGVFYEASTGALYKGDFRNDLFIGSHQEKEDNLSHLKDTFNDDFNDDWNPYLYQNRRPDSEWHYQGDATVFLSYGTKQTLSLHVDFHASKRFFAGFGFGFNTVNHKIGKESVTYDDETGEKYVLIDWDEFPDEIMTENTYNMLKFTGQCGVSWGWFSLGGDAGIALKNTIRNCRSLPQNNSYYEPGTLYYREKVTGAKFAYSIFTDFVLTRSIPYINSCSMRLGYSNIDGVFIGAGVSF
ncbi:MAG: hypothetical protein J6W18_00870 [Bacteroidaceae bacterium]|nr:hypothetical protein [Bacteroidaceae bacterium]